MNTLLHAINKSIDFFLFLLIVGMASVVFIQVIFRYVFVSPLAWPEEIARLMLVWLTFVGGYVAMKENKHISFDLVLKKLPLLVQKILKIVGHFCILIFISVVIWQGMRFAIQFRNEVLTYTNLSLGLFSYLVFPVSGVLMFVQCLIFLVQLIRKPLQKPQQELQQKPYSSVDT